MKISIKTENPSEYPTSLGNKLHVLTGEYTGELNLKPFIHPELCSLEMGYTDVEFIFCDSSGTPYKYSSVLNFLAFWPGAGDLVELGECPVDDSVGLLELNTVIDTRSNYALNLTSGGKLEGAFKYTEVRYQVVDKGDSLLINTRFHSSESGDFKSMNYSIPYSRILWRKGPEFFGGEDLDAEGLPHILLEKLTLSKDLSPEVSEVLVIS